MAQIAARNSEGMATSHTFTQVVNIRTTTDTQLMQTFRNISVGEIYENKPLAFVQTKLSKNRQLNVLKALMVSPSYWDNLISGAGLDVIKQINIYSLSSDFLSTSDRFIRILPRLSPKQDRHTGQYNIALVGGVGQVDLLFPFVPTTLDVVGAAPVMTFPTTGQIQFDVGDVGASVDISFVSVPIFIVVKIVRTHDQVEDNNGTVHPPYAYVMHPLLATVLGITIPPI